MRKDILIKCGIVLFLLLLFFGYNVYMKWDKNHFTVDTESFNVKDSFEQVMDEEYKWLNGLQLADDFNKTKDIDVDKEYRCRQRIT